MFIHESVLLPLPMRMRQIQDAADKYAQQYHCRAMIEIRGHVLLEGGQPCEIADWHTVGALDYELEVVGLGMPGDPDETLAWVVPTDSAELRLSQMAEED